MKIKSFGFRVKPFCQLDRINEAFIAAGHELINSGEPNLIYSHDCSAEQDLAIIEKEKYPNAILALKILDIPEHNFPNFDLEGLKAKLLKADVILANSYIVQRQIKNFLGLDSKVVYDIPKPISNRNVPFKDKSISFLTGGRCSDPNKRVTLVKEIEQKDPTKNCVTFGSEKAGNIFHCGIVPDNHLNDLFSISKFVLSMGKFEGIGLLNVEGFLAGSFSLVANDQNTAAEFSLPDFQCEPTAEGILKKASQIENNLEYYTNLANSHREYLSKIFAPQAVIQNIIDAAESVKC